MANYTIRKFTTREEWMSARTGCSASRAAAAINRSKYLSRDGLALLELGLMSEEISPAWQAEMDWNRHREEEISSWWWIREGQGLTDRIERTDNILFEKTVDGIVLSCTPDFLIVGFDDRVKGIVEIKCSQEHMRPSWEKEVPSEYFWQCVHQHAIIGVPVTLLVSIGGMRPIEMPIKITDDDVNTLIAGWKGYLERREEISRHGGL